MKRVEPLPLESCNRSRRFTDEQVWEIRQRRLDGWNMGDLAKHYNVSRPTIAAAVYGQGAYEGV